MSLTGKLRKTAGTDLTIFNKQNSNYINQQGTRANSEHS